MKIKEEVQIRTEQNFRGIHTNVHQIWTYKHKNKSTLHKLALVQNVLTERQIRIKQHLYTHTHTNIRTQPITLGCTSQNYYF